MGLIRTILPDQALPGRERYLTPKREVTGPMGGELTVKNR